MNTKHEKFRNKNHTHIRCWNPTTPSLLATTLMPPSTCLPLLLFFGVAPFMLPTVTGRWKMKSALPFAPTRTRTHTNTNHQPVKEFKLRVLFTIEPRHRPRDRAWTRCRPRASSSSSLFAHELLNCAHLPRIRLTAPAYPFHSALVTVKFLLAMRDAKRQRFVSTDGQFSIFQAQLEMNKAERGKDSPWRNDSRRNSRFTHWMQCICSLLLSKAQHVYSPKGQNAGPLGPQQGPQPPQGPQGAPTGAQGPAPTDQGP